MSTQADPETVIMESTSNGRLDKAFSVLAMASQALMILLYAIASDYPKSTADSVAAIGTSNLSLVFQYPMFQDVHVCIFSIIYHVPIASTSARHTPHATRHVA